MTKPRASLSAFTAVAVFVFLAACASDASTSPRAASRNANHDQVGGQSGATPSGERAFGQATVEPAFNDQTGSYVYLLTPDKSPFPSKANTAHATAPLYLVEYPPGTTVTGFNCAGVPGNCPDHDFEVASVATGMKPAVYGNNPNLLPGHDHLVAAPGSGGDFNIAWEVVEVLFTNKPAGNTRLLTEDAIDNAVAHHDAIKVDLGFAFTCVVVPANVYWKGTPVL
jgi:hypothetical protein